MTQTLLSGFVMGIGFALGASVYALSCRFARAAWERFFHFETSAG
jgi:hypothetical protein